MSLQSGLGGDHGGKGLVLGRLVLVQVLLAHGPGIHRKNALRPHIVGLGELQFGFVERDLGLGLVIVGLIRPRIDPK